MTEPTIKYDDCFGRAQTIYYSEPGRTVAIVRHQLPFTTCDICGSVVSHDYASQQLHVEWHRMWGVRP